MSKRKILTLALTLCMIAILAVGGTLAYFMDTDTETNVFTVGNVKIELEENFPEKVLRPGTKTQNNLVKEVTVNNIGSEDAYMWIEVWIPSALDDGDDNSPQAPGLGNSLHFNYGKDAAVVETKNTYLGSKTIDGVAYNGYVHYDPAQAPIAKDGTTIKLLDQVYMDKAVAQCNDEDCEVANCMVLIDGTHFDSTDGNWNLVINGIGFQAEGFTLTEAISEYYGKDVTAHIW